MIRTVLFDLDGTLIHINELIPSSFHYMSLFNKEDKKGRDSTAIFHGLIDTLYTLESYFPGKWSETALLISWRGRMRPDFLVDTMGDLLRLIHTASSRLLASRDLAIGL